jgi:D-alanine-D-alanine ligase
MFQPSVAIFQEEQEDPAETAEPPHPQSILLLYSVVDAVNHGEPQDIITDLETSETARAIAAALEALHYPVTSRPIRHEADFYAATAGVDPHRTLVFNLCETLGGVSTNASRVPYILEQLGFCYVGAHPENMDACLNKGYTKACLLKHGVPTAPYQIFYTGLEPMDVPFPAIVKPVTEDCSLGIPQNSIVTDEETLRQQVAYILRVYKQPALVEMFLDGREFSVSIWGNGVAHALPVGQIDYSTSHHNRRWLVDDFESKWTNIFPSVYPAPVDHDFAADISQVALDAYRTMGCRHYARVDIREKDGQLYVLEVNNNPSLSQDGGFARSTQTGGYDYTQMVSKLVQYAWLRAGKQRVRYAA